MSHLVYMQKSDLIAALVTNMTQHMRDFDRAMDGYRRTVAIEALVLRDDAITGWPIDLSRLLMLPQPREYTADYFDALEALSDSEVPEDALIGMLPEVYDECVLDDWPWGDEFDALYARYADATPCVSPADIELCDA